VSTRPAEPPAGGGFEATDPFARLARESARLLAELGVRSSDSAWIERHAETIARMTVPTRRRRRLPGPLESLARLYRRARSAARTAR
jgi:hypothetical protein